MMQALIPSFCQYSEWIVRARASALWAFVITKTQHDLIPPYLCNKSKLMDIQPINCSQHRAILVYQVPAYRTKPVEHHLKVRELDYR
jgi:hypothetical protein